MKHKRGHQYAFTRKRLLSGHSKEVEPYHLLDGCIVLVDIDESSLPKLVPLLKKGEPGTTRPCVLVQPNEKEDSDFGITFNNICRSVAKSLMFKFPCINNCVCYSPMWICAMDKFARRSSSHGKIHRNTKSTSIGYLTVIIFLESSTTGGIKLWPGSQDYMPGKEFGVGDRSKDFNRKLDATMTATEEVAPMRSKALVFDARLLHQNLAHLGESQQSVLSFGIACNGLDPIHNVLDMLLVNKYVPVKV